MTPQSSPLGAEVAAALQAWAEDVRLRELERVGDGAAAGGGNGSLLDQITRSVVDAMLASVTRRLRDGAAEGDGALADAARELFGLP
jgi:glutamyl-tRNA reductase